jgi:hypothetical protein
VRADLKVQLHSRPHHHQVPGKCQLLETVLPHIFSKDKPFYKVPPPSPEEGEANTQGTSAQPANEQETNVTGHSEVRLEIIEIFRSCDGFLLLNSYLQAWLPFSSTGNPDSFPTLETLICILKALHDSLPSPVSELPSFASESSSLTDAETELWQQKEDNASSICQTLVQYFQQLSHDALKTIPSGLLRKTLKSLRMVVVRLVNTPRAIALEFYTVWRSIIHTLLFSLSHPLQLVGWDEVKAMIEAGVDHRPPPRQFVVSNAGIAFVNGTYDYAGPTTSDGYFPGGANVSYVRIIPADVPEFGGRKLTLFRYDMRSGKKWWFISIADEEQPGTDRDMDYYQHKSPHVTKIPPTDGWTPARSARHTVPPRLQPIGTLVPPGQEHATLEHQMVAWVMNHAIVERLVRSTNLHPDVLSQSLVLIELLTDVSHRDADWTVAGLIPKLCELSRQHQAMISCKSGETPCAAQGAALLSNVSKACEAKKALPLSNDIERCAAAFRKRVAVEMPICRSKQAKLEVQERELHQLARDKVELRASIETLSNRKLQLIREYRKADDEFIKVEIKSWIQRISQQMAKEQKDLQEAGMPPPSLMDCATYAHVLGDSCDMNSKDNGRSSGDGKDCLLGLDSNDSSDSSRSMEEGQV